MKNGNNSKSLSKFLAVILRHKPEQFGLTLDDRGFTSLDGVWAAIVNRYGDRFTEADLKQVVAGDQNGKKRYEIIGEQIRAMYGHSQIREIVYPPAIPPARLYHGTNADAAEKIREDGLQAMGRQYVHLTTNRNNATTIAKRQTKVPLLLIIRADEAHRDGTIFHHAESEHYLARSIPPAYINFPDA